MSANLGPNIITDGCVLALDAADRRSYPGSGNTWYDLSGNKNDGAFVDISLDLENCHSFNFNGTSSYINLGSRQSLLLTEEETTIAWIYPTNIDAGRRSRIGNRHSGFLTIAGSNLVYEGMNSAGNWSNNFYAGNGTIQINTWQQVAFTFKADDLVVLYLNGSYLNSKAVVGSQSTINGGYIIGTETLGGWGTYPYFEGNMAIVTNYSRALSATEILQNYNTTKSRFNL